ncbi:MAG: T9SS type A sorting domain-containing protein [Paludibacter sp.]
MIKNIFRYSLILTLSLFLGSWGSKGHSIINSKCPESFPASMSAFRVWADSLSMHASDADSRKSADKTESPKHYLDVENYSEFVSTGRIASTYDSIVSRHGASSVISNGTLPWATMNMYDTLRVDFLKHKWHKAMLDASDLGHYVADGHMPLHISANFDGQDTGNGGIHSRYESSMVGNYQTELANYKGDSLHVVSNVTNYIFNYIYINHHYVDSVLIADTYATNLAGNTTSTAYYTALWNKTAFTKGLFHNASHTFAELIYNAWVAAGKPVFGVLNNVPGITETSISIYPNPTKGALVLNVTDLLRVDVCNIAGTKVGLYYNNNINLNNLPNGIYLLNIYCKNGLLKKTKVVLER